MATDKTLNNNNYQKDLSQGQAPLNTLRKTAFCLLIICIIATPSVYSLNISPSPAQFNADIPSSGHSSSEDFVSSQASRILHTERARPRKAVTENLNVFIDKFFEGKILLKKRFIQSSYFTEQTFPMLASVNLNLFLANRAPIDLVCVIDFSRNMDYEKIQRMEKTFERFLRRLGDQDRLSIVSFNDKASTLIPLMNATEENKRSICSVVKTVRAEGEAIINEGMKRAMEILNEREVTNLVTAIFLFSDGRDKMGSIDARNSINDTFWSSGLQDGGVIIHTFGFGRDHDSQLMTFIADLTNGSFFFIDNDVLQQIYSVFQESFEALQPSGIENVQFFIKPEQSEYLQGVEIVKAYGDKSMWKQDGQVLITKSLRQRNFVLELKIPRLTGILPDRYNYLKVASCQVILRLSDGSHIVKNADLEIYLVKDDVADMVGSDEEQPAVIRHYNRVKEPSGKLSFFLVILCIMAISSIYFLKFRSSSAKVNAEISSSEDASSQDFASLIAPEIHRAQPRKDLNINIDDITELKMQLKKRMIQASSLSEQVFPMLVSLEVKDLAVDYCAPIDLFAENVQFFIRPEQSEFLQGVEIVKAYGDAFMWKQEGQVFITKSPILIIEKPKDFVLELKIPRVTGVLPRDFNEVNVASCQVIIRLSDGKQVVKNADLNITLINEDRENEEVMKNYYRMRRECGEFSSEE